MTEYVVVDASLAFKWLVKEIHTDEANHLGRVWNSQGIRIAAPSPSRLSSMRWLMTGVHRGPGSYESRRRSLADGRRTHH